MLYKDFKENLVPEAFLANRASAGAVPPVDQSASAKAQRHTTKASTKNAWPSLPDGSAALFCLAKETLMS